MNRQQAWQLIDQVCSLFQGTRQQHAEIQAALGLLRPEDSDGPERPPKEKDPAPADLR